MREIRLYRKCRPEIEGLLRFRNGSSGGSGEGVALRSGHFRSGVLGGEELAFEVSRWHRPAEEIALALFAAHADQQVGGGPVLDAFGDHRQSQLLAEADGRTDDRRIVGIAEQAEHEGAVDLQAVEREFLVIAEARIASPEIA